MPFLDFDESILSKRVFAALERNHGDLAEGVIEIPTDHYLDQNLFAFEKANYAKGANILYPSSFTVGGGAKYNGFTKNA